METDAMDTDIPTSRRETAEILARSGGGPSAGGGSSAGGRVLASASVWNLLVLARQHIGQGNPSLALQAVVAAVKSQGGENAVLQTLSRARDLYNSRMQANANADQLASLFAECAITEARPVNSDPQQAHAGGPSIPPEVDGNSILALSGRRQIMLDAFSDGSSFVCLQCGGLVSNIRKDEHLAYWCGKA